MYSSLDLPLPYIKIVVLIYGVQVISPRIHRHISMWLTNRVQSNSLVATINVQGTVALRTSLHLSLQNAPFFLGIFYSLATWPAGESSYFDSVLEIIIAPTGSPDNGAEGGSPLGLRLTTFALSRILCGINMTRWRWIQYHSGTQILASRLVLLMALSMCNPIFRRVHRFRNAPYQPGQVDWYPLLYW